MKIAGIIMARDEADIIPFNIYYHLNIQNFDYMIICNHRSIDESSKILNRIQEHDERVIVINNESSGHPQTEIFTMLANKAYELGCEWVFPLDADEIINSENGIKNDLKDIDSEYSAVKIKVYNFLQNYENKYNFSFPYKGIKYRISDDSRNTSQEQIFNKERSSLEFPWTDKHFFKCLPGLTIYAGAHEFDLINKKVFDSNIFKILHVPFRNFKSVLNKVAHGKDLIDNNYGHGYGWEAQRWWTVSTQGVDAIDSEWRYNSENNGEMTRPTEEKIKLIEDDTIEKYYNIFLKEGRGLYYA